MSDEKKIGVGFGVMVLREGKILLGKRHDDAEKASSDMHGEGTWTMPGGKLHFGEKWAEGAIRELKEETGLVTNLADLKLISLTDNILPDVHYVTAGFLLENPNGEAAVMEPDEITDWKWFSLDGLPDKVFPPSMMVIENYRNNKIY